MSGPKLSKWEQKQKAAKEAEAKFEANQRRAKGRKGKGIDSEIDAAADAFGKDLAKDSGTGVLGWAVAHRKALIAVVVLLLVGGFILVTCRVVKYRLKTIPGEPRSEVYLAGNPGTLVLIDHVAVGGTDSEGRPQATTDEGERLTAIDVGTGKELAVDVTEYKQCWSGGSRLICANKFDQVELLDPRTLAVAHTAADLIATAKLAKPTRRFEKRGAGVVVVLEDGRGAEIDGSTLAVTKLETVERSFVPPESSGCATSRVHKQGNQTLVFQSGTRNRLTSDPPPPAESPQPSGAALTFLEGAFLQGVELPLVLHRELMDQPAQIVSRVEGISKESWTRPLGGNCRRSWQAGTLLVIATGDPARRALAIDLTSGGVVWTFGR
jgi:hypothetical protein